VAINNDCEGEPLQVAVKSRSERTMHHPHAITVQSHGSHSFAFTARLSYGHAGVGSMKDAKESHELGV
jgi:hypothetical protein